MGETEIHVFEPQLRGCAPGIVPAQHRIADHDLALPEQPVRQPAGRATRVDGNPGNEELPAGIAPQRQLRRMQDEPVEVRLPAQQRRPRKRRIDGLEPQRRTAFAIAQFDARQMQARTQP